MWSPDTIRTVCINLDRRPDRWANVLKQPEVKNLPHLSRFPAVDGSTLKVDTDPRISTLARYNIKHRTRRSHDMLDGIGGVGCALSHIALWKQLVDSDQNVMLILEDDLTIPDGMWSTVQQLFRNTPSLKDSTSWDIWSLGNHHCYETLGVRPADKYVVEDKWIRCNEFVGLQTYFISRTGAQKLLKDVFPIQQHIDWYITYYAQTKPFKVIHNKLVNCRQTWAGSDVTDTKCVICELPNDVENSHYVVPRHSVNVSLVVIASLALVAWTLYRKKK